MSSQNARLLFDSARVHAVVDARALAGGERSLLFSCGALSVDMVAYPIDGGLHVVHGQVIDTDLEEAVSARVRLDASEPVETDRHGQFAVSSLAPLDGLVVRVDTGTLEVECSVPPLAEIGRGV
jgi:hypothetical protein